jgi:hypothetical protein
VASCQLQAHSRVSNYLVSLVQFMEILDYSKDTLVHMALSVQKCTLFGLRDGSGELSDQFYGLLQPLLPPMRRESAKGKSWETQDNRNEKCLKEVLGRPLPKR